MRFRRCFTAQWEWSRIFSLRARLLEWSVAKQEEVLEECGGRRKREREHTHNRSKALKFGAPNGALHCIFAECCSTIKFCLIVRIVPTAEHT